MLIYKKHQEVTLTDFDRKIAENIIHKYRL
jgi:Mn-dependent DtxR family transcriptional regulator